MLWRWNDEEREKQNEKNVDILVDSTEGLE